MRIVLALTLGAVMTVIIALILGEYPFTGTTPYLAAILVPAAIGFAVVWIDGDHRAWLWAATGPLSAAGIGWALWISTGRGADTVPAGGWASIALALLWPLAWAGRLAHRGAPEGRRPTG